MAHLRLYRFAFAPALAALVVLAFSVEGVPAPAEPPPGTLEFDAAEAMASTRAVLAAGAERRPGSAADDAVADLVAERFGSVVAGTVGEQAVEASVEGEDVELRNVLLTLPGSSDHAIVVLAGRDSREGEGAPSSAAATGVLLQLSESLAIAERNRTLIMASTSGSSAEAQGARELIDGLPDRTTVDAVVVVSQPGFDDPYAPHVVTSGGGSSPSLGLARTAEEALAERAMLSPGRIGALAQIARYAVPAAAGDQAALLAGGVPAVSISSAGELPLPASRAGRDRLDARTLERIGPALLALIFALDSATAPPESGPEMPLRIGDNVVPGWSAALVILALLLPAAAVAASVLAEARRGGSSAGRAFSWALEWWLPPLLAWLGLVGLGLVGVVPASGVPYDPARFDLGFGEVVALLLLLALAAWLWWILGLRRVPSAAGRAASGAAGFLAVGACAVVWLANPYLALALLPLAHVVALLGARSWLARLGAPALLVACMPLIASVVYVGSELGWGTSSPWQLSVLVSGGGIGAVEALGAAFALASAGAVALAATQLREERPPDGSPDRGKPGGVPPGAA